jgi:hypothetical protein
LAQHAPSKPEHERILIGLTLGKHFSQLCHRRQSSVPLTDLQLMTNCSNNLKWNNSRPQPLGKQTRHAKHLCFDTRKGGKAGDYRRSTHHTLVGQKREKKFETK